MQHISVGHNYEKSKYVYIVIFHFHPSNQHIGKPVAVTHSKGQGKKGPVPGSDIEYEQRMWSIKKSKNTTTNPDQRSHPDPSVEGFGRKGNLDSFSSMSEIASCSYEARQVSHKKS